MIRDRGELEQVERAIVGPWALLSANSRGRAHPEAEAARRTAFQRDRDRIIHAAAFRRLQYKTQVFLNDAGDYYRTRLTHSLETAQIGRALARALHANEDLVEAICLAHDLGHPPFGHVGEAILNRLAAGVGGFDHNLQAWRIVTQLESRFRGWPGLNLTWETLEGMMRHETESDLAAQTGFDPGLRGSLEAQIANISDSLAYQAHDLDDGLQSGLLHWVDLETLEIWRLWDQGGEGRPVAGEDDGIPRYVFIRELIGLQVEDVLSESAARLEALSPKTPMDLQTHSGDVVAHSEDLLAMKGELSDFLYERMYLHEKLQPAARLARESIETIFAACLARPDAMPLYWRKRLTNGEPVRAVVDFMASLTDRSALKLAGQFSRD
ncbi:MAG: dNTP triphosphohydrolase [Anaerolineaceae bacterium]|nr:dNTP triphosphohydrolase [Anaerolineaceae bacterium]